MAIDPRYSNSSGYFKDPITEEDLSPDTPRVIPCSFENGKFTWPCVAQSDGGQLLKIVYKYFTEEEKELYKAYRGRSSSGSERKPRKPKPKPKSELEPETNELEKCVVKYNEDCVASGNTEEIIAMCDILLGVSQIDGIFFALLSKRNSNTIYHVPRSLISDADFDRLCHG